MTDDVHVDHAFLDGNGIPVTLADYEGRSVHVTMTKAVLISHEAGEQHWVFTHYLA